MPSVPPLVLLLTNAMLTLVVVSCSPQRSANRVFRDLNDNPSKVGSQGSPSSSSSGEGPVWPPLSIGENTVITYGLSPRANFYSACGNAYCHLFGGVGASMTAASDLFEMKQFPVQQTTVIESALKYNRVYPPSPPSPRTGGKMVMLYSSVMQENIYFVYGGTDGTVSKTQILDSAYLYSPVRERWYPVLPPAAVAQDPLPMTLFSMVSLGGENFTVFFGVTGTDGLSNSVVEGVVDTATATLCSFNTVSEVSAIDEATGDVTSPPRERVSACCVANPTSRQTVCFGGHDGVAALNDTWIYEHDKRLWRDLTTYSAEHGGVEISTRIDALCTFFNATNSMLLFGGFHLRPGGDFYPGDDTNIYQFSFDTLTWSVFLSNASKTVARRGAGAMVITNQRKIPAIEIFGGIGIEGVLGDRWVYTMNWLATPGFLPPPGTQQMTQFIEVESGAKVAPEARMYHSAVAIGAGMLIAFGLSDVLHSTASYYYGQNASGMLNASDTWTWVVVDTYPSVTMPAPRFGASVCAQGSVAYFYGGFLSADRSSMTNELWALTLDMTSLSPNSLQGNWQLLTSKNSADFVMPALAFHGSFFADSRIVIIGGLVISSLVVSSDVFAFDLHRQQWLQVLLLGDYDPRAGFSLHFNGSHAFIFGGETWSTAGKTVSQSLAIMSAPQDLGLGLVLRSNCSFGSMPNSAPRAYGATAGSGNNFFVCGGAEFLAGAELGPPTESQCLMIFVFDAFAFLGSYDISSANSSFYHSAEGGGIGSTAVLIGSSLIVFGGSVMENRVRREGEYVDTVQHIDLSKILCSWQMWVNGTALYGPNIAPCLLCGRGSVNSNVSNEYEAPRCIPAPAGHYSPDPLSTYPCPPGRTSTEVGSGDVSSCVPCSPGSFAPLQGMTSCLPCPNNSYCPMGAVRPQTLVVVNNSLSQQQPQPMPPGTTPTIIFVGAGCFCLVMLCSLGILSLLSQRLRLRRRDYFFNTESLARLRAIYKMRKRAHFGLDKFGLEIALRDLGIVLHRDLVVRVLAQFEQDGSCHLTFTAFQEVIISLIERGLLPPFPQTGQSLNPGKALSTVQMKIARFNLKALDSYDTQHSLGVEGESIRIHSTISGGVTSIVFNILALTVALALSGQFFYANIIETTVTLSTVESSRWENRISVRSFDVVVVAVGGTMTASECVVVDSSLCATGTSVLNFGIWSGLPSMRCEYDPEVSSCSIHFHCDDCIFILSTQLVLEFVFGGEIFASSLNVSIVSDTGIRGATSSVTVTICPWDDQMVFRGYPATRISSSLVPTLFETVDNLIFQNVVNSTGYHALSSLQSSGQIITASQMNVYYGVPVEITFDIGGNVFGVKQLPKNTVLDFISQLLGSITGMGGILVMMMRMYDSKFISRRHDKLRGELEQQALDDNAGGSDEEMQSHHVCVPMIQD